MQIFLTIISGVVLVMLIIWGINYMYTPKKKQKSLNDVYSAFPNKDNRDKIYPQRNKGDWRERVWHLKK